MKISPFSTTSCPPEYFRTLRIPMVSGREFERRDDEKATSVAIVNETLARRMWQTPDAAIGKRFKSGGDWLTIVGVARDVKYARLTEEPRPYFYLPFLQAYTSVADGPRQIDQRSRPMSSVS